MLIECTINGRRRKLELPPLKRLLDVLREDVELTGTKEGCGEGECGSCTVLVEGQAVNACLVIAAQMQGKEIVTVEGLARDESLTPLQDCFITEGGAQCGICTPGMLLSARVLLDRNPQPTEDQIRVAIAGNLCRCTGYQRIVNSILKAAELERTA